MSEQRSTARQKSFLRGCIYFNNRRMAVDCLIRDLSRHGARLVFSDAITSPDVGDLYIPQKDQMLPARVHWRRGREMGIAFGAAGRAPNSSRPADIGELAERVEKLESELARLRRMLKRLRAEVAADGEPEAA